MTLTPQLLRSDLKCGNGSISEGEQCHVGQASKASSKKRKIKNHKGTLKEQALMFGGLTAATIGGATWAGSLAAEAVTMLRRPRSKDIVLGISRQQLNTQKARTVRTAAGVIGNLGLASIGASMYAQGRRTRNSGLSQSGQGLITASVLGAGVSASNLHGTIKRKREIINEAKAYRDKVSKAKQRVRDFKDFADRFTNEYRRYARERNQSSRRSSYAGDPFNDLGVSSKASPSDIKKQWIKLLKQHHPDQGGDPERAKRINEAYQEIRRQRGDSVFADGFQINVEDFAL